MRTGKLRKIWSVGFVAVGVSVAGAVACDDSAPSELEANTSLAAAQNAGLSGTWQLNLEESDDPRERFGDGEEGRPGFGRRARRGAGGPRDPGAEGGPPGGGRRGELVIVQDESTVTITHGPRSATLYTDGRTETREVRRGQVEATATYEKGAVLVIERSFSGGATMTRTFTLSDDERQLFVTHQIDIPERARSGEFRMVFDRV